MALPQQQRLSGLQLTILNSVYTDLRHRSEALAGMPYADLVRAIQADKTSITEGVRQLMRKGLLLLTLPRGGWTRYVTLTEQGKAFAKTLPSAEQRFQAKVDPYGITDLARRERLWRDTETRRAPRRDKQPKRSSRRTRREDE